MQKNVYDKVERASASLYIMYDPSFVKNKQNRHLKKIKW